MSLFRLEIGKMSWINGAADDPADLCLHGQVTAHIGNAVLEYECALNAAGIYLLRTITEDHIPAEPDTDDLYEPLLPCCGHEMYEGTEDSVVIYGCGHSMTWKVEHHGALVSLTAEGYPPITVSLAEYSEEILSVCDQIEAFYSACSEKQPEAYEIAGYNALWNEWHRRRNA